MTQTSRVALMLSMVDIAQLARVQRPVISMWRTRYRHDSVPFPAPADSRDNQDLFDAQEVVEWLQETGRGNNPDAAEDMALFASEARDNFDLVTALLTLRALSGETLTGMHPDDVLDLAEEIDPDDEFIFSELDHAASTLEPLLSYVDQLVDSAYTAPAAFEKLMDERPRFQRTEALFDSKALALVAVAAKSLSGSSQAFAEATPGGSDLLLAITKRFDETASLTLSHLASPVDSGRLTQRRLHIHASSQDNIAIGSPGVYLPGQITVAHFPAVLHSNFSDVQVMTAIDDIALDLGSSQAAVVLAPARLLTDKLASGSALQIRDTLLRSGKIRAIVRLPAGLLKSHPRQHLALWLLGKEQTDIAINDRWGSVADVSTTELNSATIQDLIADLLTTWQSPAEVRARAFRFARFVKTSLLLAGDGNLTRLPAPRTTNASASSDVAETLVKVEGLLEAINNTAVSGFLEIGVEPGDGHALPTETIEELLKSKHLKMLPGTRFQVHDITAGDGFSVIGATELIGTNTGRSIDRLVLAANYPHAPLTEPGDVIFSTSGKPRAWVDSEGLNVVEYPARILRISAKSQYGLIASVVAQDINTAKPGPWRRWHVKRFHEDHLETTKKALELIDISRQQALDRAAQLEQIAELLTTGCASAALQIIHSTSTLEGNS